MASTKSLGYLLPQMNPVDGRAVVINDRVTVSANVTIADTHEFRIPAGFELSYLRFKVPDMDASTGMAAKIGYAAVDSASTLAASDAYFRAEAAVGQAAAVLDCDFVPITFQEDVKITITWTAAASGAFTAGTIYMTAIGNAKGPR